MMKFPRFLSFLAIAGFAFAGVAFAQGHPGAGKDNTSSLMQSYQQKIEQLKGIQQKTIHDNPKLAAEMKHFNTEVNTSMRAHGYDMAKGRKRVEAMAAKFKSGNKMTKAERMSAMASFEAERQKMMTARAAVMKEPRIQKDGKMLQQDMIAAMKKQDSRTAGLLKDVNALRMKIMMSRSAHGAGSGKG